MEIKGIKEEVPLPFIHDPNRKLPKESKPATQEPKTEMTQEASQGKEKGIQELVENINRFMRAMNFSLQFIPDRESGSIVIKVLDSKGEIIRQIPPEAITSLSSRIGESIGILLNSKL